jgi:transcriptional regulator with XRE-family HTH domain
LNIRNKRLSLNLTQEDVAKLLNVSRTTVSMWETGESMPRAETLPELAKLYKCSIDDLFDEHEV